jgi:hypothetical protein
MRRWGHPVMGCQNPYTKRLGKKFPRRWAYFLYPDEDKSPDRSQVRRVANILNKHTILSDCSEPPDHIA